MFQPFQLQPMDLPAGVAETHFLDFGHRLLVVVVVALELICQEERLESLQPERYLRV
jgi:hypothetical protein